MLFVQVFWHFSCSLLSVLPLTPLISLALKPPLSYVPSRKFGVAGSVYQLLLLLNYSLEYL